LTINLELVGEVDGTGKIVGLDFAAIKSAFRSFVDAYLDHSLLLNEIDPFARQLLTNPQYGAEGGTWISEVEPADLPGLRRCAGDPTTENIAMWIAEWAALTFTVLGLYSVSVHVDETDTNGSGYECAVDHLTRKRELTDVLGRWK
jgi:6-pyruvoyl-tetrahydropterin synthase